MRDVVLNITIFCIIDLYLGSTGNGTDSTFSPYPIFAIFAICPLKAPAAIIHLLKVIGLLTPSSVSTY